MSITVELDPEVEKWLACKVQSGGFASPSEFVSARLHREWIEEALDEAVAESSEPLTSADWTEARARLEEEINRQK